jgi:hypothetical protein
MPFLAETMGFQSPVMVGAMFGVQNAAGGGAGQPVTVTINTLKNLPANYGVLVNPGQDATWFVSGKSATGFSVTLTPRLATSTLAAGTIDIFLYA